MTNVTLHQEQSGCANEEFLPTPYRMNEEAVKAAVKLYDAQWPRMAAKFRACGYKVAFDADVTELQAMIRKS